METQQLQTSRPILMCSLLAVFALRKGLRALQPAGFLSCLDCQ